MPDITVKEILALRDLLTNLSPNLSLALAEQINQMVSLGEPMVEVIPTQEILGRSEILFATVFSLSAPSTSDVLLTISPVTGCLLADMMDGLSEAVSEVPLTEAQVTKLDMVMQGLTRGLATALTNLTGDIVEVESCNSHVGPMTLPPAFAMDNNAVQAIINLNLPQLPEAALTFMITPELVHALVSDGSEESETQDEGGASLSEADLAAMLGELSGVGPAPTPPSAPQAASPFPNFAAPPSEPTLPRGMEMILDIPLDVTVELGRVRMLIKDVLDLSSGSIVELDRVAGEPVDLLVNGRLIAKGEVVVIEDNFGIRITEIISPADRVAGLGKGR
jgi:flagellar motor switch protein FliN/FliY